MVCAMADDAGRSIEVGRDDVDGCAESHRVVWFSPDRPVEGVTIYVRPDATPDAASG